DAVVSTGVLSSLVFDRGVAELARIVKDDGTVWVVDTLAHHPVARLSRWLKYKRGIRTEHAFRHILTYKDLQRFHAYFERVDVRFFDLTTLVAGVLPSVVGNPLAGIAAGADRLLLNAVK